MLSIKRLDADYNGKSVLQNISFDVKLGEKLAILGPNGCGKTTLLKAIAGLKEYQGEVTFNEKNLRHCKRAEMASLIALMSQSSSLYFPYTVLETVMMGRYHQLKQRLFATPRKEDIACVEEHLQMVGLFSLRNATLDSLSGGQLQRVFLARALIQNPKMILLDEPNNHLDIYYQLELLDYLDQWLDDDRLIIGVFHDLNLALSFSENIMFMREGKLIRMGQALDILSRKFLTRIFDVDVLDYMLKNEEFWKKIAEASEEDE